MAHGPERRRSAGEGLQGRWEFVNMNQIAPVAIGLGS
jgi:hypothetical protein